MGIIKTIENKLAQFDEHLIEQTMAVLVKVLNIQSENDKSKYRYYISIVCINCYKLIFIFALAIILGIFKSMIWIFIPYYILQRFTLGVHLNYDLPCLLWDVVNYIGGVYFAIFLSNKIMMTQFHIIIFYIFALLIFILFSPAQTKKRPVKENERLRLKIKSLIALAALFMATQLLSSQFQQILIMLAIFEQLININPVTYKLVENFELIYERGIKQ